MISHETVYHYGEAPNGVSFGRYTNSQGNVHFVLQSAVTLGLSYIGWIDELAIFNRPLADLRHAFLLDDYPIEGKVSGEFHLYGKYQTPYGFGRLQIDEGAGYSTFIFTSALDSWAAKLVILIATGNVNDSLDQRRC